MKKEELMIGDWVSVSGTPIRIAALGTVRAGFIDGKGEMFYHGYDSIEPIPLTEEILVNNGFKRIDTTIGNYALAINVENEYDVNDYNRPREFERISTYLRGGYFDGFFEIENRIKEEYSCCRRSCKYIHEFQHALRLCGIEKEIKSC